MPSFDIVSEVDLQEVRNAVDQANRELRTRFDFRNVDSGFEFRDGHIVVWAEEDFQLTQLKDILYKKCAGRKIEQNALVEEGIERSGKQQRLKLNLHSGIDRDTSKVIANMVRKSMLKIQVQIQGDKVRVSAGKRDDLQQIMQQVRELEIKLPVQFNNYRD